MLWLFSIEYPITVPPPDFANAVLIAFFSVILVAVDILLTLFAAIICVLFLLCSPAYIIAAPSTKIVPKIIIFLFLKFY